MVAALVSLIVYLVRNGNEYSQVSDVVKYLMIGGIVLNAIILIEDFSFGAFLPFACYTVSAGVLLNTEMLFVSNVLTNIDGTQFDAMFFVFIGALAVAVLMGALAFVTRMTKAK